MPIKGAVANVKVYKTFKSAKCFSDISIRKCFYAKKIHLIYHFRHLHAARFGTGVVASLFVSLINPYKVFHSPKTAVWFEDVLE